ncbi:PREDICTED: uncharacterized protein LOC108374338 [Rhagoletis zephyria]|uniref:uncharacterized protein LOC108374338 n=1 Tax=Rhagoletis zephyria TaxID=28612 RepID=UPI000811A546|nr:PREDICTED: uncharacterized protein LOC108374338 [Rhagoletis zephyria]
MCEGGVLKVSYRKQLSIINYEPTNRYEQIIKLIIQRFNIPATHERALLVSTENGRIFDRLLFDYFLTLFPNPNIIFYIRYDYNRAQSLLQPLQQRQEEITTTTIESSDDTNMKKEKGKVNLCGDEEEDQQSLYNFTPVYRMNCFIYEYPTTKIRTTDNNGKKQNSSAEKQSPRSEFAKRVKKRLQIGELKKRTRKPLAQVKRIMRL